MTFTPASPASVPDPKIWDQEKIELRALNAELLEALKRCCEVMRECPPNCTVRQWFAVVDAATIAIAKAEDIS